jgi:hypothetical protein
LRLHRGHGRTGTFLAALVATMGENDAINYVRTNYCQKAVESRVQVDFLAKHFGVKSASGTKSFGGSGSKLTSKGKVLALSPDKFDYATTEPKAKSYSYIPRQHTIWR